MPHYQNVRQLHFLSAMNAIDVFFIIILLCEVIPLILEDTRVKMESWGAAGTFDPFDKIYEVSRKHCCLYPHRRD